MIVLALHGVRDDRKATDEQMKIFHDAILGWWKKNKEYPEGF